MIIFNRVVIVMICFPPRHLLDFVVQQLLTWRVPSGNTYFLGINELKVQVSPFGQRNGCHSLLPVVQQS